MNPNEIILKAFLDRRNFSKYYDLQNSLFASDRIKIIHDAKTISVAITSMRLNQTYGFDYYFLYQTVLSIFSAPNHLRLSELVDTKEFNLFTKSIDNTRKKYGTYQHRGKLETISEHRIDLIREETKRSSPNSQKLLTNFNRMVNIL